MYGYAHSAPHHLTDPLGLKSPDPFGNSDPAKWDPTGILYSDRNELATQNCGDLGVMYRNCGEKWDDEVRRYWMDRHSPSKKKSGAQFWEPMMRQRRERIQAAKQESDCPPGTRFNSGYCWVEYDDDENSSSYVRAGIRRKLILVFFSGAGDPHWTGNDALRGYGKSMNPIATWEYPAIRRDWWWNAKHWFANETTARAAAKEIIPFIQDNPDASVVVAGYSRGGPNAVEFVNVLGENGFAVESVLLFDPQTFGAPLELSYGNFEEAINFFQENPSPIFSDNPFKGGPVQGAYNIDYTGTPENHNSIVDAGIDWLGNP